MAKVEESAEATPRTRGAATQLVHGGTVRSQHGETSRGDVPQLGLRLPELGGGRAAVQEQDPRLHLFALLEPHGRDVPGPHGAARRRRGGARLCDRHGGGHRRDDEPGARRRPCRRVARAVRRLPLRRPGLPAALRRDLDAGRWARPRRISRRRCRRTPRPCSSRRRPTRRSTSSTSRRWRRSRMRMAPSSIVDNVFATPILQSPLKLGADLVVYSATKHIDGQGRVLGGVDGGQQGADHRRPPHLHPPDRAVDEPVQRVGAAQGARDAAAAGQGR